MAFSLELADASPASSAVSGDAADAAWAEAGLGGETATLPTDYLNHFHEILMLLELVPGSPEMLEIAAEWRPRSFLDYADDPSVKGGPAARAAYLSATPFLRGAFDAVVARLHHLATTTVSLLTDEPAGSPRIAAIVDMVTPVMRGAIADASQLMLGDLSPLAQTDVDLQGAVDRLFAQV